MAYHAPPYMPNGAPARESGRKVETIRYEVEAISRNHLDDVRTKIADLRTMEAVLSTMVAECKGGAVPECPVVETLFEER